MDLKSIVPDRVSTPAKLFLSASILNGFANGIFNVVGQLYLASLGFDSAALGTMFMMIPIGAALFTIPAGVLADRYGKRKVMLSGFALAGLAMILFLTSKSVEVFMAAFLLIGLSNASSVVFVPLYASFFDKEDMDRAFGLNGFLSVITLSLGSLMGFVPPMLVARQGFSLSYSYWTMIAVAVVFFITQMPFYLMSLRGVAEPETRMGFGLNLKSKGVVAKFCLLAVLSNIGFGIFFSLFPFYVNRKFGIESDALGTLFFLSNFVSAGANVAAPVFSKKLGTLRAIAATIGLSTPFYLMIPLAPNFTLLSAMYILRRGFATISDPLIGSLFMRLLYEEEKATANSIRMMASWGGGIAAPWLGGKLMEQASIDLPAYIGGGLYPVLAVSYFLFLRNEKQKEVVRAVED